MNGKTSESFVEVVNKQAALYNGLKETITAESKALMEKDAKAIDAVTREAEAGISKIKELETLKAGFFEKLAKEAGYKKDDDVKLAEVIVKLDAEERAKIEKALAELIAAMKAVDAINAVNVHLLKNYLEYDGFSKNLKKQIEEPESTTYTKTGSKQSEKIKDGLKIDRTI